MKIRLGAVVGLALVMLLNCAAGAQVMQQIPADALVVVKINNLKATNDKIAKLAQDLGLAVMVPPMADPLAMLQAQMKITQGIDTAGEAAFVFVNPDKAGGQPDRSMFLLIPVTDYKTFLTNWSGAATEGEVTTVKIGDDPEPAYVANWGKYAALSPTKEIVATKPAALLTIPAVSAKELASKDIILYANFVALKTKLLPDLQAGRAGILGEIDNGMRRTPQMQKFVPVFKAAVNQGLNIAERYLNDTQAATVGVSITPVGINATLMSEFTPGSYIGNTVTSIKNTDAPLLAGLPEGKYLIYGGTMGDPQVVSKLVNDLVDPIIKELVALGPDMKPVQDYADLLKKYIAAHRGQSFGMLTPTGALGAEPLLQVVSVQSGDAKTMADSYTQMIAVQQQVMKTLNVPGTENVKPVHTANAKTIDGVSFDSVVTKVEANAQNRMAMQQAQMMSMIYGPAGAVVLYGAVGDKLLIVSGVKDDVISKTIATTKENKSPAAETANAKLVAAQLPKQRVGMVYIGVGDLISTVVGYARQFGLPAPVQLPPDLPPVGVAVSTESTAMRIDVHVPLDLIKSIAAAAMQAQMQMMQGPGGGGL